MEHLTAYDKQFIMDIKLRQFCQKMNEGLNSWVETIISTGVTYQSILDYLKKDIIEIYNKHIEYDENMFRVKIRRDKALLNKFENNSLTEIFNEVFDEIYLDPFNTYIMPPLLINELHDDVTEILLEMKNILTQKYLRIYAYNYNILRISSGIGSISYY